MIESRGQIQTYFQTGDEPTQAQFYIWLESFLHLNEDADLLGLSEFDATRDYKAMQCVVYQGGLYQTLTDKTAAAWTGAGWVQLAVTPGSWTQFDPYDANTTYPVLAVVEYQQRIFRSLQNGNLAKQPTTQPLWWEEISPSSAGTIPIYVDGAYAAEQVVEREGRLWRATTNVASAEATFTTEVAAGTWQEVRPYRGVPDTIASWDTLKIAAGNQHRIKGPLVNAGTIINHGRLIIE